MSLILRTMNKHLGWEDTKNDYVVLDRDQSVGRIYKEHNGKWVWSVNTSPYPAPSPSNGVANSLEEAKQQFKQRYEEMKSQGVRPFSGDKAKPLPESPQNPRKAKRPASPSQNLTVSRLRRRSSKTPPQPSRLPPSRRQRQPPQYPVSPSACRR
jgi:hypothetical protein